MDSGLMGIMMESLAPILSSVVTPMMMLAMVYLITLIMTELMTNNAGRRPHVPAGLRCGGVLRVRSNGLCHGGCSGGQCFFYDSLWIYHQPHGAELGGYTRVDYVRFGWLVSLCYSATVFSTVTPRLPSVNQIRLVMMSCGII